MNRTVARTDRESPPSTEERARERAERWTQLAQLALSGEVPEADIHRLGQGLGEELFRSGAAVTSRVRAGLAPLKRERAQTFAGGYLSAVTDLISGFELVARNDQATTALLAALAPGTELAGILRSLVIDGAKRPTDLAQAHHLQPYQVSRLLTQLRELSLVDAQMGESARERLYAATPRGRAVLDAAQPALSGHIRKSWAGARAALRPEDLRALSADGLSRSSIEALEAFEHHLAQLDSLVEKVCKRLEAEHAVYSAVAVAAMANDQSIA